MGIQWGLKINDDARVCKSIDEKMDGSGNNTIFQ